MCGIAGSMRTGAAQSEVAPALMDAMAERLAHRGPDGSGTWIAPDSCIGLAHRRLAIIDLSEDARQPMSNEDGSLWISFNGEIYNHAELRTELDQTGNHRWRTDHSDTEVILHAFEEWGIDCVHRFRGMFAFALWDARARALWLVRDRVGIKPLYYSVRPGRVLFASEIKALLADPAVRPEIDEEAFFHYLSFLTTPAPTTLYRGIRKLAAGTWLRIGADGEQQEHRYWDVWDHVQPMPGVSEDQVAEALLAELRTAVRLRKVSDVPVGVFLSGGIDSSTNAVLFSEGQDQPVKTFSIAFEQQNASVPSELGYARQVARLIGAEHYERILTRAELTGFLERMAYLQDEPLADPVCVPVYFLAELARANGVVVCQLGEGADELFWGYPAWKRALRLQHVDSGPVPAWVKKLGLAALRKSGRSDATYYEWLRRAVEGQPVFWGGAEAFTHVQKERVLSGDMRARFRSVTSWDAIAPIYRRFADRAWEPSPLHWMSYLDLNLRLPELLLMRVDKMTMGVGVEARVPFLDHRVVELALSVPSALKTRGGTLKYLLKRAVKGLLPEEIINRRKQGFAVPVGEWLFDEVSKDVGALMLEFCDQTNLLDADEVTRLMHSRRSDLLWPLLNVALTWKQFGR